MKEKNDLITIYKFMNNLEKTDRKIFDIEKKRRGQIFEGIRKNCKKEFPLTIQDSTVFFPKKSIDTLNGLKEEVIMIKNVHQLNKKEHKMNRLSQNGEICLH